MRSFVISTTARKNVQDIVDYLNGIDESLKPRFINCLKACYEYIETYPMLHQKYLDNIRMAVVQEFSHKVFYEVFDHQVVILAILHTSREEIQYLKPLIEKK